MVSKKMTAVLMIAMLSFVASSVVVNAATEEAWAYNGDYDDEIKITVDATTQAAAGDKIDVTVYAKAKVDIEDVDFYFSVQGTTGKGSDTWATDEEHPVNEDLDEGDSASEDLEFEVDDKSDTGMILGHIVGEWTETDSGETRTIDIMFPITYITGGVTEEEYTALQAKYNTVSTQYNTLSTQYNTLNGKYTTLEENNLELTAQYDALNTSYSTISANYGTLQTTLEGLTSDYNTLESDLNTLETQYTSLQTQFTEMQNNYNTANTDLTNTRNYMYLFIVTTIIGLGAAVVMAMRGRK